MRNIQIIGETCIEFFCAWTLAYHICLAFRLPAIVLIPTFLCLFAPMLFYSSKTWRATKVENKDNAAVFALIVLALLLGVFAACANRFDPDDIMFFYRALHTGALNRPFYPIEPGFSVSGVPVISVLHLMTSYEILATFFARLFHLDPLWVYQVGMAFAGSAAFPFVYFVLYREFGLGKWAAVVGSAFAALFLFVDGNVHRSFGNFAFVRMWQGKGIVITLLLPATILLVRAYLKRPSKMGLIRLGMLGVCGIGLTDIALYLIPVMVLALSLSYAITERFSGPSLRHMVFLWASMLYPLAIGAALVIGLLPEPKGAGVFWLGYSDQWRTNTSLVIDSPGTLIRNVVILVLAPLVALKGKDAAFLILFAVLLVLIFANPLTAPVWIKHIFPASYWRLFYLFPLPFLFGLAFSSLTRATRFRWEFALRALAVVAICFSTVHATRATTVGWVSVRHLRFTRFLPFKSPWEYNLPPNELAFCRSVSGQLKDKKLLAPERITYVVGLTNPSVKFEECRGDYTMLGFYELGEPQEGLRRLAAENVVATGTRSPAGDDAVLKSVEDGVNAIVVRDTVTSKDEVPGGLINTLPGSWRIAARSNGYILLLSDS